MRIVRFIIMWVFAIAGMSVAAQQNCARLTLPLSEDFDRYGSGAGILPDCWYASRNYDIGESPHLTGDRHYNGTSSLVLYPGTLAGSHYSIVITPELDATDLDGIRLRFRMLATSTAARLEVGFCADTLRYSRAFVAIDTLHVTQANRWQEVLVDLGQYSGEGRRLSFRMQRGLQDDGSECYIDELRLETCGLDSIGVINVGSTELTLLFEQYGSGSVSVAYDSVVVNDASSPLTITGLQPQTGYTFTLGCPGGIQHTVSATTLEGAGLQPAYYLPIGTSLPQGWRFYPSTPTVAGNRLRFNLTGTDSCIGVLPLQEDAEMSDLNIAMVVRGTGSTMVVVGVMDYAYEMSSFVPIDTIVCTDTEQRHLSSLSAYSGGGHYIALMAIGSGTVTLGEVRVARCMLENLRLYNLTESEVTLEWDTLTLNADIQMEYGLRGFTPGSGTVVMPTTCPYTLDGLDIASDYDIYIWPACGDSICSYDKLQFTTFEHSVTPPYCTGFEDLSGLPQGWVATGATLTSNSYSGSQALSLGNGARANMPLLNNSTPDTLILEFYSTGTGSLSIGTANSAYSTPQWQATVTGNGWQHHSITVTSAANKCIVMQSSGNWVIDALTLHTATIHDAAATQTGQHVALLQWTLSGTDSTLVEYSLVANENTDFVEGGGTVVTAVDSLWLTGLQAGSHYAVHLRPYNDPTGCNPIVLHLRTLADSVALPYCENYEGIAIAGYPDEWRRHSSLGEYPIVSTERNHTGSKSLYLAATATEHTIAVLPDAINCNNQRTLAFWSNVTTNPEGAMLIVGSISDMGDESSFTGIDTIRWDTTDVWRHHEIHFTLTGHLALRLVGGNSETHLFIDDLCLDACIARNVRLGSVQQNSATLTWQGEDLAGVIVHISGATSATDTFYTSPAVIEGLSEGNTYYIRVEALCECGGYGAAYLPGGTSTGVTNNRRATFSLNTLPSSTHLPICNSFEGYSTGTYPYSWRRRGLAEVSDRNYHGGGHSLHVESNSYIILPQLSAATNAVLSMYMYSADEAALGDSAILIGTVANPDSVASMTVLDTIRLESLGEWQNKTATLNIDNGRFTVIRCKAGLYIDDLSLAQYGISDVTVSDNGILSWIQNNCSSVAIEYGPSGFTRGEGISDTATASPYAATGLDPATAFDYYLKPLGSGTSCQEVKVSLGNATSLPYCEWFDLAPLGGMPQGWNIGRSHEGTPCIMDNTTNKMLCMKAASSAKSIAVLPMLDTSSLANMQLCLSMRSTNSNRALIIIGEMTNASDPNTFVAHDTLRCTTDNTWQTKKLTLSRFTGTGRMAIACAATSQSAEVFVDSIGVIRGNIPNISPISARSVLVTYENPDGGYLEYGLEGTSQGEGTIVHITSTSHIINNLTPDTTLWFYSRADSLGLTCLSPQMIIMPDEVNLPYCHHRDTVGQLILPEFNIDSIRLLHLYVDLLGGSNVAVGVMEHQGDWSSFVALDTLANPSSHHIELDTYTGDGRFVALKAIDGGNFIIGHLQATRCPLPTVRYDDNGTVVISGDGIVEYEGGRLSVSDSLILNQLSDTAEYNFIAMCYVDDSVCGVPVTINTTFTATLPYCPEIVDAIPTGWDVVSGTVTASRGVITLNGGAALKLPIMPEGGGTLDYEELTNGRWTRVMEPAIGRPVISASRNPRTLRHLHIEHCMLPDTLSVSQPGGGDIAISWDDGFSDFYVKYHIIGDSIYTTLRATSSPMLLHLAPDTSYEFSLLCDSLSTTCRWPQTIHTMAAGADLPYCVGAGEFDLDTLPSGWRTLTHQGYLYAILPQPNIDNLRHLAITLSARGNNAITLGTMSDANNPETFDSLVVFSLNSNQYTRCFHSLANYYGNGRFLALRSSSGALLEIDRLTVSTCAAYNVEMISHGANVAVFDWQRQGSPDVKIVYGQQGSLAMDTVVSSNPPCRIEGLSPLTNYVFYATSSCPEQDSVCPSMAVADTFFIYTPQGGSGCIDYTDLTATYVTCGSGSYGNPSQNYGAIDFGYLSAESRHTVHFDTSERDQRTGGLLRTIPEGVASSVRLGNWLTGGANDPQAESITYALSVDSGDVDLLILQYAAVLQDPEHSSMYQPRFRLEILNSAGEVIDSCSMADFIANASLGWNIAAGDVLWKDWTTVGLDMTPYAGQTILIRLTTYDCGEGSHFGYAYFTLNCAAKRMETEGCSNVPTYRFTVPTGFSYRWYTNLSDSTISTNRSILVPSNNDITYLCQLTAIDNPACTFSMSAFAGARFPLALFDTAVTVADCQFTLQLTDRSTISFDGETPAGLNESCETLRWLLPDGDTSSAAQQTLVFGDTGTVSISLIAGIADDQCIDTLTREIHLAYPYPHTTLTGAGERCHNDTPTPLTISHANTFDWADTVMSFAPDADSTIAAIVVDTNGCRDTLTHLLIVHPVYLLADSDTVCSASLTYSWRDTTLNYTLADTAVYASLHRLTALGCDSTMTMALSLLASYDIHHADTICDNTSLPFFDTVLTTDGVYLHAATTLAGCDSLVTMHLATLPTYVVDDPREACDSLRWIDGILYLADTAGVNDSLLTTAGCDSVIILTLDIHPSYLFNDADTVCSSNLVYPWRDTTLAFLATDSAANATLHRSSIHNCDSTMTLNLSLWPSYNLHHTDTICDDATLPFFDTVLNTTGSYLHSDTTLMGCDSLVTMHLTVFPTYSHTNILQACDSLRWLDGVLYLADTAGPTFVLPTVNNCDSLLTLQLSVYPSYDSVERDTFCSGNVYLFREHQLTAGGYYADTLRTIHTCDSILAINLTERPLPLTSIYVEHDCLGRQYRLHASTDVPFIGWQWGSAVGSNFYLSTDSILDVKPTRSTAYVLSTAYIDQPQCMARDTVVLERFVSPEAILRVSPQSLTPDNTDFDAYDQSLDYLYRRWFIDGERQEETSRHLAASADADADTVTVSLVVGTEFCSDTATASIAIRHQALYVPTAFTPGAETNNTFFAVGVNIARFEIYVYSRTGTLVFHAEDINSPWDGRNLSGEPCPTGNYVYNIRYSTIYQPTAMQSEVGTVLLIR